MAATEEVCMPREVHNYSTYRNDGECLCWREVSEWFSVTNGVKQGCVLVPTPFSIFLSAMLDEAFRDKGNGVYIQSRQSPDLFTVAHFRAKTKTTRILMREQLFADDSALLYQPNSTRTREEDIMVDRNKLNSVLEFTYIGSTISLSMTYRGGWPRLVHLSADYARDFGTTTMCPCGLKAR